MFLFKDTNWFAKESNWEPPTRRDWALTATGTPAHSELCSNALSEKERAEDALRAETGTLIRHLKCSSDTPDLVVPSPCKLIWWGRDHRRNASATTQTCLILT